MLWLLLLLPIYAVARYPSAGAAGGFVLVGWLANAIMLAGGGLWIGATGMLATAAIGALFRERLRLARFFKNE